ncbi:MAG: YgiT-type zinc finger protein [bacterium]
MCGGRMEDVVTNLPFKVAPQSIIIVKYIPVVQCVNCREYLIKDAVMERVDRSAELEIFSLAA